LRDQAADFVDITEDRGAQMEDYIVVDYAGRSTASRARAFPEGR
jgi:hypothetical protein